MRIVTYLSNPADVLISVLLCESKVLVQPKSYIVAIEAVCRESQVQQMLLKRRRNCRLAGCRKTGEPDCEALLLAELVALVARERRMPCNVAVRESVLCVQSCARLRGSHGGAHVAILYVET